MSEIESYFLENFPGNDLLTRFNRWRVKQFTLMTSSEHTRNELQSSTAIKAETLRHLLFHRNIIHCFSRFRYIWDIVMMITYGLAFFVIPIDVAFCYGQRRLDSSLLFTIIVSLIDIICLMDILLNFWSSYQDHMKRIVLEGNTIVKNYVRSYFWVDLLSSFPDRIVWSMFGKDPGDIVNNDLFNCANDGKLMTSFACYWDIMVVLSLLKFFRMPTFRKMLDSVLRHHNTTSYRIRLLKNLFCLLFWYHFVVCLSFFIARIFNPSTTLPNEEEDRLMPVDVAATTASSYDKYIVCFYYTTHTITMFAREIVEKSQVDMTVAIAFTLIGFIVHIWLVSKAFMLLRTVYSTSIKFEEIRHQLKTFMAFKGLSSAIQKRVLTFYDFSFHGKYFRRQEITELFGNELRSSVTLETCEFLLSKNFIFKQLPEELLSPLANCLTEAVYLSDDVIGKVESTRTQKLHFIVSGTVAVYNEDGDELAHLHDGNMFGEVAFLLNETEYPCLNYVATEETVLLVLARTDFMKVLAESPGVLNRMRRDLRERFLVTDKMTNEELIENLKIQGKLFA